MNNTPKENKVCCRCRQDKPIVDFYRDSSRKDGSRLRCKECDKAYLATHKKPPYKKKPAEFIICHCGKEVQKRTPTHQYCSLQCRAIFNFYRNHAKNVERSKKYAAKRFRGADATERTKKKWLTEPEKMRARALVKNAVLRKEMKKLPCEVCGELKVHAHHHLGYEGENAMKVQWLCPTHHYEKHRRKYAYLASKTNLTA